MSAQKERVPEDAAPSFSSTRLIRVEIFPSCYPSSSTDLKYVQFPLAKGEQTLHVNMFRMVCMLSDCLLTC